VGNFSEGAGLEGGAKHSAVFAVQLQSFVGYMSVVVQGL